MGKLPFVVQPKAKPVVVKIGTEETGIFEIERRGYLNVAEKSFVDNFTKSSDSIKAAVSLSNKISTSKKVDRQTAYQAIMKIIGNETLDKLQKEVARDFETEIVELTALFADIQEKRDIAIATILLQSRVNQEWTLNDTLELDPRIVLELSELYAREEAKEAVEGEESVEELLGK